MNRRTILKAAGSLSLLSLVGNKSFSAESDIPKIKPNPLKKGDKVTVIAPGSAVSSPNDIDYAIEIIDKLGLDYEFAPNVINGSGYKTRSVQERADDFNFAFESDSKAVFCIRGGYGSSSIINSIDYRLIKSNPKIFAGFSDITALHLAIYKETKLVTFHSPVLMSSFNSLTFNSFKHIIFNEAKEYIIENPPSESIRDRFPVTVISPGTSEAELVGGNLSLISSLMGTPYEIDTTDKILFIEDVGEAPYRIHRMLTQLELGGKLKKLKGVVIGYCNDCDNNSGGTWDQSEMEVYFDYFSKSKYPVMYGLLLGHSNNQFTLPLNLKYKLDTENEQLVLKENPYI